MDINIAHGAERCSTSAERVSRIRSEVCAGWGMRFMLLLNFARAGLAFASEHEAKRIAMRAFIYLGTSEAFVSAFKHLPMRAGKKMGPAGHYRAPCFSGLPPTELDPYQWAFSIASCPNDGNPTLRRRSADKSFVLLRQSPTLRFGYAFYPAWHLTLKSLWIAFVSHAGLL